MKPMAPDNISAPPQATRRWRGLLVLGGMAVILVAIAAESMVALAIVLMEGTAAIAILLAGAGAGVWIVHALGLCSSQPSPTANTGSPARQPESNLRYSPLLDRWIIGAGLGVGSLSILTLVLGVLGMLNRGTVLAMVVLFALAGVIRVVLDWREIRKGSSDELACTGGDNCWWWLLGVPFAILILLAATLPPGVLWGEEGSGYDVLEYHLAVPKIWHELGRITFLDNNIYSNFPLNSEMLSLLAMSVHGDAIEAAFLAQMLNAGLCGLLVLAAWWAGRAFSRRAAALAGVLAITTPWIGYLGSIAYVEVGMLATGMLALGALLRGRGDAANSWRWAAAAGLLAGLACGYKYTAVAMIAIPLAIPIVLLQDRWQQRLRLGAVYALGALVTFSPWLIRNTINTHNPVFPLAYSVFGAKAGTWDSDLEARWQHGHRLADVAGTEHQSAISVIWQRTVGDWRVGWLVLMLAAWGVATSRDRLTLGLLLILAAQMLVWYFATHLYARFAAVMLLPLIVLAARAGETTHARTGPQSMGKFRTAGMVLAAVLIAGAGWNLYALGGLYYDHTRPGGQQLAAYGQSDWFVTGQWPGTQHVGAINALEPAARVMLVGEARTFYVARPAGYATVFNHHPLAEMVEQADSPAGVLERLREQGITHVLVHWGEMQRLRRTYGFERSLSAELFESLEQGGLQVRENFSYSPGEPPYATLYQVGGA